MLLLSRFQNTKPFDKLHHWCWQNKSSLFCQVVILYYPFLTLHAISKADWVADVFFFVKHTTDTSNIHSHNITCVCKIVAVVANNQNSTINAIICVTVAVTQSGELDLSAEEIRAFGEEFNTTNAYNKEIDLVNTATVINCKNNTGFLFSLFHAQHIDWALVGHTAAATKALL